MFKMTLRYTRYALNLLAVVGFGSKLN